MANTSSDGYVLITPEAFGVAEELGFFVGGIRLRFA